MLRARRMIPAFIAHCSCFFLEKVKVRILPQHDTEVQFAAEQLVHEHDFF
jgi:hypothetical protein